MVPTRPPLAVYNCAAVADGLEEQEPMLRRSQSSATCHRPESWDSPRLATEARQFGAPARWFDSAFELRRPSATGVSSVQLILAMQRVALIWSKHSRRGQPDDT